MLKDYLKFCTTTELSLEILPCIVLLPAVIDKLLYGKNVLIIFDQPFIAQLILPNMKEEIVKIIPLLGNKFPTQWRIQGGAQQARPTLPPKIGSTMLFVIQFLIKMVKNKAQIARETIKTTL